MAPVLELTAPVLELTAAVPELSAHYQQQNGSLTREALSLV